MGIGESSSLDSEQIIYTAIGDDDKSRVESMENCISYSYLLDGVTVEDTDSIEYLYYYADDGRLDGYTISGDFTVNVKL